MKIQILSDVHIEFHKDRGRSFWKKTEKIQKDLLIIAGDFSISSRHKIDIKNMLNIVSVPIILVLGNHDYYENNIESTLKNIKDYANDKLFILENDSIVINDITFRGMTGWFPDEPLNQLYEKGMTDFYMIKNFRKTVYDCHQKSKQYLIKNCKKNEIIISHHLPIFNSVNENYISSVLNRFYISNFKNIIEDINPKLWIHGHTHESCDYHYGNTRIICNPYGYKGYLLNSNFKSDLVIEL